MCPVAPLGFCNRGEWGIGGLEYEVPSPGCIVCGSLLDGLAMYLSCDTKKFHDNESTHILYKFWASTHRGKLLTFPLGGATACVGVCCTYRALALQQAGGGEATAGQCAGTSRHSSSSWQPSSSSSSSRRRTMRRGPDGTPTATDERARRRLSTRQRHQQRSERRRTDLKANSHRRARHDTDTTVLSSLVWWRCELSRPDSQAGAFCVWSASECVRGRSATAGRTPTQNALVRRLIHTAIQTRLPRLPVDRRCDAGQWDSYA